MQWALATPVRRPRLAAKGKPRSLFRTRSFIRSSGINANRFSFQLRRDAFQRREKANEDYAIRQREKEKLLELRQKLKEQQQHLERLAQHMFVPL